MKMILRLISLVFSVCVWFHSARSDVSHLVFGTIDPFYGFHPVYVSSTPRPILPEIIVNSAKTGNGYHYEKPEIAYLPPAPTFFPQADPPFNGYLPPSQSVPLADAPPPPPPSPTYLPPVETISENLEGLFQNDIVLNYPTSTNGHKESGYHYDRPTTTPVPVFIPQADPVVNAPENNGYIYEIPKAPTSGYLPPNEQRLAKGFDVFNGNERSSIQLQLNDMHCIPSQGGYFKSVLTLQNQIYAIPVVDTDVIDNRCDLRLLRQQIYINIAAEDFQRCGVAYCGTNLCLRIRFPLIGGMKTGGDSILTLQCKVQDRVVSKTHALKVGVSNEYQSRSVGALAQGGSQLPFRTHLELLRKTANGFTKHLEPNGVVQLGEDMQLRAHVRAGDGWNYTRLADVNLQRVSTAGEIINSASLVNPSGCINPSMRSICPVPPLFEPPLGHRLTFKAAMFQGMRSGDELLMSVKIVGCIDQKDCHVNSLACDRSALSSGRHRRGIKNNIDKDDDKNEGNTTELSETSTISFRVQMPDIEPIPPGAHLNIANVVVGGILCLICLICLVAVLLYLKFTRKN